jgi:signal transduction histidine kinase
MNLPQHDPRIQNPMPQALQGVAAAGPDLQGRLRTRVLVVEDEVIYATWLSEALRKDCTSFGCTAEIVVVGTMRDAVDRLSSRSVDVVLLDLNLPDSSGLATVVSVLNTFPQIPVIVLSATCDEGIARQAIRLGAQDYLFKGQEAQGSLFRVMTHSIERKLKESEYRRLQESALHSERMAAVGTLASGVAHEYNNIAAVILGNVELGLRNKDISPGVQARLVNIHQAILRCRDITSGLLDFVRGFRAPGTRLELNEVVRASLAMCRSTLVANQVTVSEQISPHPIIATGNASELGQVILNVIINACHAMVDSPVRQLHLTLHQDPAANQWAVLRIADTGIGIPPEHLDKVFLPFFSTKGEHTVGEQGQSTVTGTGLGLSICDTYIRQHGGTIILQSAVGGGTCCEIRLPISGTSHDASGVRATPGFTPNLKHMEILIIDDQADVCEFMSDLVEEAAGCPICVSSGSGALAQLALRRPALIFLDWEMPDMNGAQFIEHINADQHYQGIPLVIISGHPREFFADKPVYRGPYQFLLKPFDIDGFYQTIVDLTAHR